MSILRLVILAVTSLVAGWGAVMAAPGGVPWWEDAVVYQIYPRSFQDSSGDGVGDLRGILSRVDYLQSLGVDAVWISPIYPSPMRDFGYDISNFTNVDPLFGSLSDLTELSAALHARGLRLILDFVPNHSSDLHPWFKASRASKNSDKRDWYIWRNPKAGGGPPTNWLAEFGGSAWTLDQATGQYYYHAFLPEQPDLNWRYPPVQRAMLGAMKFWLARGVDGFRVDAPAHLIETAELRDEPANPDYRPNMPVFKKLRHTFTYDQPETHAKLRAMRQITAAAGADRLLLAETDLPYPELVKYYGTTAAPEAQLPFNFHLIKTPWQAEAVAASIRDYEAELQPGDWPNWVLGNHDQPRLSSRIGAAQTRVAAMLLLTLRGTPTLYYGDELGLTNVAVSPAQVQDPWEKREPGKGRNRDPERSPMPWDSSPQAGFSPTLPWLPLNADYVERNVAAESRDPLSVLSLYRRLLKERRAQPALRRGSYKQLASPPGTLVYERRLGDEALIVALNFTAQPQLVALHCANVVVSTVMDQTPSTAKIQLRADEGQLLNSCR